MHKSRLAGFIIDCQTDDLEAAARFWSEALGWKRRPALPDDPNYIGLDSPPGEPYAEVQLVDHPSRVHLDIETDDIEAEVERLISLGARRIAKVKTWVVMEAPTGQRFCVVRVNRDGFEEAANAWNPDE